jgi:hypothetical protein
MMVMASMEASKENDENGARDESGRFLPGHPASGGRPKGSVNRATKALKAMILEALDAAGGVAYLTQLARDDAKTFATLLLRLLPPAPADGDGNVVRLIDNDPDI